MTPMHDNPTAAVTASACPPICLHIACDNNCPCLLNFAVAHLVHVNGHMCTKVMQAQTLFW